LADIFENFCDTCIKSYGLNPAHYNTLPGFTWDAMLKHTRKLWAANRHRYGDLSNVVYAVASVNAQIDMRGLITSTCRHTIHRNRLPLCTLTLIICTAMYQPLPYAGFRWVEDTSNFDVSAIAMDSPNTRQDKLSMIKSVTSFISVTCSSARATVFISKIHTRTAIRPIRVAPRVHWPQHTM